MSTPATTTFEVSDVKRATAPLPEVPYQDAVEAQLSSKRVEACSRNHGRLLSNVAYHPVVAILGASFLYHHPLCLSPEAIWLMIIQGVAHHINVHAEELRSKFVASQGKVRIEVRRDDFVKGSPENPWSEVFDQFESQIRDHVGPKIDWFLPAFSTTGRVERAAAGVVLFDAIPSYFESFDYSLCGIPAITLEGTPEDWSNLTKRAQGFREFGLGHWIDVLSPILDQFARASNGDVDQRFWQSVYKFISTSGGGVVNGWIAAFFPYRQDRQGGRAIHPTMVLHVNEHEDRMIYPGDARGWESPLFSASSFPGGLSKAPFRWHNLDQSFDMEFLAGFVGVAQDEETLTLRPEIGWAVREAPTNG
jgi:Domain of unknown function (DUF4419)